MLTLLPLLPTAFAQDVQLTESTWVFHGDQARAYASPSYTPVGDLNGDGYGDAAVVVARNEMTENEVYVYMGGPAGLDEFPSWTRHYENSPLGGFLINGGDVNGDGYSDLVLTAGFSNAAGFDAGQVDLFLGSAAGPSESVNWSVTGPEYSALGIATAIGDVNADGYADILLGAGYDYSSGPEGGSAYLYLGSAVGPGPTPAWSYTVTQEHTDFGWGASYLGDVNGDGYGDVAIGALLYDNGNTDEGRVYVFHGRASGLRTTPARTLEVNQDNAWFGAVTKGADVNGDGYGDLLTGAYAYDNGSVDEGRAYAWYGGPTGIPTSPAWVVDGNQEGCQFGSSTNPVGDVNGDGYADVFSAGAGCSSDGIMTDGVGGLYLGSEDGLSPYAALTLSGGQDNAWFGWAVGAGDVNGDGYDDFLISGTDIDDGEEDEGEVRLYLGGVPETLDLGTEDTGGGGMMAMFGPEEDVHTAGDLLLDEADSGGGCNTAPGGVELLSALVGLGGMLLRRRARV